MRSETESENMRRRKEFEDCKIKAARGGSGGAMEHLKEYKLDEMLHEEGVKIRNDEQLLRFLEKRFVKGKELK